MLIIYPVRMGLPHDTWETRTVLRSGRRRQANSGMICMISRHLTAVLWLSPAPSARNSSNVPSSCHSVDGPFRIEADPHPIRAQELPMVWLGKFARSIKGSKAWWAEVFIQWISLPDMDMMPMKKMTKRDKSVDFPRFMLNQRISEVSRLQIYQTWCPSTVWLRSEAAHTVAAFISMLQDAAAAADGLWWEPQRTSWLERSGVGRACDLRWPTVEEINCTSCELWVKKIERKSVKHLVGGLEHVLFSHIYKYLYIYICI